ncbi:hypothetical protein ACH47B_20065 [Rhodococcus sp. NPDC019627]|uniref:hypothetical protein n=1 Tax=unclassified Rhodococcus (in: high G+C Gram-positive bacteria) TaxID=192944 RepID=UPI0033FED252
MKAINSVRLPKAEDICAPVEAVGGELSICTLSGTRSFYTTSRTSQPQRPSAAVEHVAFHQTPGTFDTEIGL